MAKFSKYELRERELVLKAYNYRCAACGAGKDLQIDHIHPVSAGGADTFENKQVLCAHCNNRKNGTVGVPRLDPIELTDAERKILEAAERLIQAKRDAFVSYLDECKRVAG